VRSDQYPFVKRGVPAVFVLAGYHAVDPTVDAQKLQMFWIQNLYHTPKDDMRQPIDFTEGAMVADFAWRLGDAVANATARPQWKKGDFFGTTFGR
ncbi:MAG: M28 family peptidase, partial [Thermoanaerobaculia bacterium]